MEWKRFSTIDEKDNTRMTIELVKDAHKEEFLELKI